MNSFDEIFGQINSNESESIKISMSAIGVAVTGLIGRLESAVERQANDSSRQEANQALNQIIMSVKRMSSKSMARKFRKMFGQEGAFNIFQIEPEERQEMMTAIIAEKSKGIRIEASAAVKLMAVKTVFGIKANKKSGRFDDNQIRDIRIAHLIGEAYRKIGKKYQVSGDMIRSICIGECYKDVHAELID